MSLIRFHPVILGKGRGPGILRGNGQPGHTSIADLIKYTLCLFRRHSRYYHNHVYPAGFYRGIIDTATTPSKTGIQKLDIDFPDDRTNAKID